VIWTGIPILILVVIAVPSFRLLYFQDVIPEADFTIKTTGNQWNWTYEYPDHGGFHYVANMVADEDIASHPFCGASQSDHRPAGGGAGRRDGPCGSDRVRRDPQLGDAELSASRWTPFRAA
jgi:heme/copper-type cytochrome/quinol oxidase subunit 2